MNKLIKNNYVTMSLIVLLIVVLGVSLFFANSREGMISNQQQIEVLSILNDNRTTSENKIQMIKIILESKGKKTESPEMKKAKSQIDTILKGTDIDDSKIEKIRLISIRDPKQKQKLDAILNSSKTSAEKIDEIKKMFVNGGKHYGKYNSPSTTTTTSTA